MKHLCSQENRPRRVLAALALGALVGALAAGPAAAAPSADQDLEDRRDRVTQEIDRRADRFDQSSARLVAATQRQQEAETGLQVAQENLAQTRGELAAAQALDSQMQAELTSAVQDLRRARAELAHSRTRVEDQETRLATVAVESYQSGDPNLLALAAVLSSQDPAQLTGQMNTVRNVLDKESVDLDRLEASRVLLEVQESEFARAKAEVARKRAAAAENLRRKEQLEARAEEEAAQIEELVVARTQAREEAAAAKEEDARQLRELEAERERIATLLRQRAEEARAAAEARRAARKAAREAAARQAAEAREARKEARRAAREARKAEAERSQRTESTRESRPSRKKKSSRKPAPAAPPPRPPATPSSLLTPVSGYLTSSYGMRLHPVYKRWSLHDGTDFGAACGTPVRAATSGRVVGAYYHSAYGNRIIVDHGYRRGVGLGTSYNHLSRFSTRVGERVERGEVIGYVGTTGYSTGCHLHFMVFENGSTVNPMSWL